MHTHGVVCQSECGAEAAPVVHAAVATGCCCDHATEAVASLTRAEHSKAAYRLISGSPAAECADLCSLCVAATLSVTSSRPADLVVGMICDETLPAGGVLSWPLEPLPSGLSSRGPPIAA